MVDGRKIPKKIYPNQFNFDLIKRESQKGVGFLINFNNLVMEQHIVKAEDFKMPKPFDKSNYYLNKAGNIYRDKMPMYKYPNQQQLIQ